MQLTIVFFSIAPCFVFRPKKTEEPPKKTDMDQSKKEGKEGDTSDSDSDDSDDMIGKYLPNFLLKVIQFDTKKININIYYISNVVM